MEYLHMEHLVHHYNKHGIDMGFSSAEEYERAANEVLNNANVRKRASSVFGSKEYYLEDTDEFVVIRDYSKYGSKVLKTYYKPNNKEFTKTFGGIQNIR